MSLEFVKPQAVPNVNVLLYGPAKSGKTTGATSGPGPVVVLNADRRNATRFAHLRRGEELLEVEVKGLKTLTDTITFIRDPEQPTPATVAVDPIGDIYRLIVEEESNRALNPQIDAYRNAGTHIERFCRALCDEPVNTVLVCHEMLHPDQETGRIERLPFTGSQSNTALGAKLAAMVDVVGYCGAVEEQDRVKYIAQLVSAKGRRGGARWSALGTSREIDLTEWLEVIAQAEKSAAGLEPAVA
jgi:hypothetical protein